MTPKIYFGIIVRRRLQKYWWLYLLLFLFSITLLFSDDRSAFALFIIIYGIAGLPINLIYYYFWAASGKNNALFQERQLTLENEKLAMNSDGMYSELPYKHIQNTVETTGYLLFYIAKAQFIYIPKAAFANVADIETFKELIKTAKQVTA